MRQLYGEDCYVVALVPRLAPVRKGRRSKQALFDEEKVRNWFPDAELVHKGALLYVFNGRNFVNGLLHVRVHASSFSFGDPAPIPEDLGFFVRTETSFGNIVGNERFLRLGDRVRVNRGEYIGLEGNVTELDDLTVHIVNSHTGDKRYRCAEVDIPREELQRLLHVGDHVMVKAGPSKGRFGLILSLDGDNAVILPRYRWPSEAPFTPVSLSLIHKARSYYLNRLSKTFYLFKVMNSTTIPPVKSAKRRNFLNGIVIFFCMPKYSFRAIGCIKDILATSGKQNLIHGRLLYVLQRKRFRLT